MSTTAERLELPGAEVREGADTRWRVHGVTPRFVVAPESAEAAAALLRLCSERRWHVELAGRGAMLDGGRPPAAVDVLVTSERLTALDEYAPVDLTATIGAGATLFQLRELLEPHGQFVPLDPPGGADATLGAVIARADAGPLRLGYGTPRDHVLGLQLVTGDGRILELGGRVMKNVAGYDLVRLAVGSRGTLGLLTRVTVRLRPRPQADATLALRSPTCDGCLAVAAAVREARLEPVAMELLSPEASAHVSAGGGWTLLVRLHGAAAAVDGLAQAIERLGLAAGLPVSLPDQAAAAGAWAALARLEAAAGVAIRIAGRPGDVASTLQLAAAVAATGREWAVVAHAGDGIVRVLGNELPDAGPEPVATAVQRARLTASASGGTVTVARAPAALLRQVEPFHVPAAAALMRRIRAEFDPAGVLSPGRFEVQESP